MKVRSALVRLCGVALALAPVFTKAAIDPALYDAANCAGFETPPLAYVKCDDGIPTAGGETANAGGLKAIRVPGVYQGATPESNDPDNTHVGLPPLANPGIPGADAEGYIALDVNFSLPTTPPPAGGYPLLFFMHGCCGGNKASWEASEVDGIGSKEKWHYSNAWFATRGYAVVTYTARGFRNGDNGSPRNGGSTGQTELDSRSYEINDYQHLACQLYASAGQWTGKGGAGGGGTVSINPGKVVVTGGSYGGGFSWMALTDPVWTCTPDTGADGVQMRLAVAAPRYGWTDLLYSLVPTGRHLQAPGDPLPSTDGCDSGPVTLDGEDCPGGGTPVGVPKKTIDAALYASGATGVPPGAPRTTFPPKVADAIACLQSAYPAENSPACMTGTNGTRPLADTLPEFMRERSAYYQNHFFQKLASDPSYAVPVFNAATLTDPLFPPSENRRMHNRLRSTRSGYPLQVHFGDHQHFVQNKWAEWADMCESSSHSSDGSVSTSTWVRDVCLAEDYEVEGGGHDFDASPPGLARVGITSRLNRFIDHYAKPASNPQQAAPTFDATVSLQVCPDYAAEAGVDPSEPGDIYTANRFEGLTGGNVFEFSSTTAQATTPSTSDSFNAQAEPVQNSASNGGRCPVRSSGTAPSGQVATYNSEVLAEDVVMIGGARVALTFTTTDATNPVSGVNNLQFQGRLFDVRPNGSAVLIDRGPRRVTPAEAAAGAVTFQLHGNAYRFLAGHRIRLEILQDDDPYMKRSDAGGGATISSMQARLPRRIPANRDAAVTARAVEGSGAPGEFAVRVGDFTLKGGNGQGHAVTALKVGIENPHLLKSLVVVGGHGSGSNTAEQPGSSLAFDLVDTLVLRPGDGARIQLFANLADATETAAFISTAHAADGSRPGGSGSGLALAAGLLLAVVVARHRRRVGLLVAVASLGLLSCNGGGGGGGGGLPDNVVRITLTAVTGTADDGQPGNFTGLPLELGTITVE